MHLPILNLNKARLYTLSDLALWKRDSARLSKGALMVWRLWLQLQLRRASFSVQLITICAVVNLKCAVEEVVCVWTKKCKDSGQIDDLCADYQVLCSCKSFLKYALQLWKLKKGVSFLSIGCLVQIANYHPHTCVPVHIIQSKARVLS